MAEHVIDAILQEGAKHQYEKYLHPKILPFAAASTTAEQSHIAQVSISFNPADGSRFQLQNMPVDMGEADPEAWADEEEP